LVIFKDILLWTTFSFIISLLGFENIDEWDIELAFVFLDLCITVSERFALLDTSDYIGIVGFFHTFCTIGFFEGGSFWKEGILTDYCSSS
jgi:hypothetical protein